MGEDEDEDEEDDEEEEEDEDDGRHGVDQPIGRLDKVALLRLTRTKKTTSAFKWCGSTDRWCQRRRSTGA